MEKINIAELLKDCPSGMELDCPLYDNVTFERVADDGIWIKHIDSKSNEHSLYVYNDGSFPIHNLASLRTKCIIFPKGKTTWEGFHRPFKDGDILTNENGSIFIYKGPMYYDKMLSDFYCGYRKADGAFVPKLFKDKYFGDVSECRFATEKEKQQLFDAIVENGYKWNPETKTLEDLLKPKFKIGDKIQNRMVKTNNVYIIVGIKDLKYFVNMNNEKHIYEIKIKSQDDWELAPNKFDITTLKPFDKVLVRLRDTDHWKPAFWGKRIQNHNFPFITSYGSTAQAIPFKGNEWIVGTTEDCSDYYKTW